MHWLLCENSASARYVRTVLQGLVGSAVVYLPQFLDLWQLPEWLSLLIVLVVMAILAPLMAKLGERKGYPSFDECVVCDADGNIVSLQQALEECPEVDGAKSRESTESSRQSSGARNNVRGSNE